MDNIGSATLLTELLLTQSALHYRTTTPPRRKQVGGAVLV